MSIKTIIENLKARFIQPRVYALVAKSRQGSFLILECAWDLETAYAQGKANFKRQNPGWDMSEVKIDMFTHVEFRDLLSTIDSLSLDPPEEVPAEKKSEEVKKPEEVPVPPVAETKNDLMMQIVKKKDSALLEEKKSMFSEAEYKYLVAAVNKK